MNVIDLKGNKYKWSIKGTFAEKSSRPCSNLHKDARHLLISRFPTVKILEEVKIYTNVVKREFLFLDFYIPVHRLSVEVHGEQHFKFSSKFYNNQLDFINQKDRDTKKKEWCEINNIQLIILSCYEQKNWKEILDNV